MRWGEVVQGRKTDDGLDLSLEDDGKHHDVAWQRFEKDGGDRNGIGGDVGDENAPSVPGALSHEVFTQSNLLRIRNAGSLGISGQQFQVPLRTRVHVLVDHALMRVHEWHQLGQQHLAHGREIPLPLKHSGESREVALQPVLLGVAVGGQPQVPDHGVDVVLELGDLAASADLNRAGEVALGDRGRHLGDGSHLCREVRRQEVHVPGQILPGAGRTGHVCLTTEASFHADLARDRRDLIGKGRQRAGHVVDRFRQRGDLSLRLDGQVLAQVAVGHGGDDLDDATNLLGEIGRHDVDVVGEVLPGARDTRHLGLTTQQTLGADLASHTRHFRGERVELVHHGVDGVLQLENLALHVDGDLARQVAARDGRRDFGDVAHLRRQVRGEQIHVVGEVFPRASDPGDDRLTAETPVRADLTRHTRHLGRKGAELLDHGVQGVFEQQDLAAHVHGDLLGEVSAGDRRRHLGDVADLGGEVAGHEVHVVGQVLPRARHALHLGLAAELALRADLACHTGDLRREGVELIHHRVDRVLELEDFALDVDGDLARQVAASDGRGDVGDVPDLRGQVVRHRVDAVGQVLPRAGDATHVRLTAQSSFRADLPRHARHLAGEGVELVDHRVDGVLDLQNLAADIDGDLLAQVTVGDRRRDLRYVTKLNGEVAGHGIDGIREVLPGAGDAWHLCLSAQLSIRPDFPRHACHFGCKRIELIDHRVDGVLQLENFALHVNRDLPGQVTAGNGRGHLGNVPNLGCEIGGEQVHVVGQVFPGAGHARHLRLTAELALRADLARHAGRLRRRTR